MFLHFVCILVQLSFIQKLKACQAHKCVGNVLERVQQERLVPMVKEDILDPLVLLESKVFQALVEKKVQR